MLTLELRAARERAGLSQQQLAADVGVRQATISALERGESRRIEFDVLEHDADAAPYRSSLAIRLDVPPMDLFHWEPPPAATPRRRRS